MSEEIAAKAWNTVKDAADPDFGSCQSGHKEELLARAKGVLATGVTVGSLSPATDFGVMGRFEDEVKKLKAEVETEAEPAPEAPAETEATAVTEPEVETPTETEPAAEEPTEAEASDEAPTETEAEPAPEVPAKAPRKSKAK